MNDHHHFKEELLPIARDDETNKKNESTLL